MSNFLRSLFGDKKSAKSGQVAKSKMQTRRLELIGLEERITPAVTASMNGTGLVITTNASENIVSIVAASSGVITINATTVSGAAIQVTGTIAGTIGGSAGASTLTLTSPSNLTSIALVGDTIGDQDFTITGIDSIAYNANFGLSVSGGSRPGSADNLNFTTAAVTLNGNGALAIIGIEAISIAAAADITAANGAVDISSRTTITTAGNVTTTSGAITYTGDVTLTGNVTTTSTLASGNLSIVGALALAGSNFTANQGLGNVTGISGGVTGIGNLNLTGAVVATGAGVISITGTGELNARADTGDLTFAAGVSAPTVKATSLLGNVVFSSTVASTVGKIEVSAVSPTKAISIANTVTGANNANITLNGDVLSTSFFAKLISSGTGDISIVGKVSASTAGNNFGINGSDDISISGVVDGTIGDFGVAGTGTLNLGNNITTQGPNGINLNSAKTKLTADVSLKTTGSISITKIDGAKKLTLETSAASTGTNIFLDTVGQDIALDTVTVTNSGDVNINGSFTATNVVLMDTFNGINFNSSATISSLTTAAKGYFVSFSGSTVLSGAPEFLNTGNVTFFNDTLLPSGATITGSAATTVTLDGNIVSGGAFNIGALPTTTITTGTNLFLNSATAVNTFAGKVVLPATDILNLIGVGTLTLAGESSNSFVGGVKVINGTLNVTGKIGASSISAANNGTISGPSGTIGKLLVLTAGTIAPGGTLSTAAVTLNSSTNYNFAVLSSSLAANLKTSSAINLGGATLKVTNAPAGLAVGNVVTIIDNTAPGTTPVVGTFAGLNEGADVSGKDVNGNTITYTISYKGGTDANDVTLKVKSIATATPVAAPNAQPMVPGQPALNKFTAIGTDVGGGPLVTITFPDGTFTSFFAFASTFTGGVRVALGNVDGGTDIELITGAGPGGGPQVNVYKIGTTGAVTLQKSFFAFSAPSFTGGVYVAAGDTDDNGFADVIVGAGAGGGSPVQVYSGSATGVVTTSTLNDYLAYSPAFTGGVVVAAGQRDAVAGDEIITAPASGGGYNIKSFNGKGTGNNPTVVDNFFAFNDTTSVGGLSLAAGSLNAGNIVDLIIGTTNGGYGMVLDSATSGIAGVPFAGFTGAIRAGVAVDSTGKEFAVALAGPNGGPRVSVFSVGATSLTETDNLFVLNPAFRGGLFGSSTL